MKKSIFLLKILIFTVLFLILTIPVAFLLKDDTKSYSRALFHEFYEQKNIDYLICGASHVSHGLEANVASQKLGKNVFNTGTSQQQIDGTLAIINQTLKLYKPEKIFLELDFAITCGKSFSSRTGFSSEYIVASGIKDFSIKSDYLLHCSKPKYYPNAFLPIGKDKMLTLNPKKIFLKLKSIFSGEYFKYTYSDEKFEYAGKGCVLDSDEIKDGTFSDYQKESKIDVKGISDDWKVTVDKIIDVCKKNGVELIFYSMPGSDFYLNQRGNYDEYYDFCRDFFAERGFSYYDFNLARPDILSLLDSDFVDDNHLSKKGIYKWTDVFCDFFASKYREENSLEKYFYSSYAQKMQEMDERIFGLYVIECDDRKSLEIIPVKNHVDSSKITFDVYALCDGETITLAEKSTDTIFPLPDGKSGKIRAISYIDGVKQNDCVENFASF